MMSTAKHSVHVVDSPLRKPLSVGELAEVIETGIKFFLFQRNQIPLPYDKLEPRSGGLPQSLRRRKDEEEGRKDEGAELSGWERIRALKIQKREGRKEAIMAKRYKKILDKEKVVKETWDELFQRLRLMLSSPPGESIRDIMLIFGPSVFNPTEVVQFSIHSSVIGSQRVEGAPVDEFKGTMRGFYKNLIMSSAFLDFTTKQLRSTSVHLCVLTDKIIKCGHEAWKDANPLENFSLGIIAADPCSSGSPRHYTRTTKKLLQVKLQSPCDTENYPDGSDAQERENLFCYQIPLKYRGVRCFKM